MRWLAVIALAACTPVIRPAPANVAVVASVILDPVVIDPDSEGLRDKRYYWKKWSRAYMSQVPGPVCICESKPMMTWEAPTGTQTSYMTICSTYR